MSAEIPVKTKGRQEGRSFSAYHAFHVLIIFRFISALYNNINDCDETYNYWEPAHYLMHGSGFQTWEYSPVYAIRSYAYILIHILPLFLIGTINKIVQFYTLRLLLALVSCFCEIYFYRAIKRRYGSNVALLTLLFLAPSNGMFIASTAFLPSSFTMYTGMIAVAAWLNGKEQVAIFSVALGSIIGWPFFVALGIPIAADVILIQRRLSFFCIWSIISLLVIGVPVVCIDSWYYGKFVFASINIIMYNVFGGGGPDLYGTEPWTYYFANCLLNFNIVFILSLLAWPLIEIKLQLTKSGHSYYTTWRKSVFPVVVWAVIFFTRPHKEERFLFPIYPLIVLLGAMSVILLQDLLSNLLGRIASGFQTIAKYFPVIVVVLHGLLGISRSMALHYNYQGSMQVYAVINSQSVLSFTGYTREINVCVGKEWHRFSSNYFLPDKIIQPLRSRWHLRYIKSDFKGQLPKLYAEGPSGTSLIPSDMNDENREEPSRYFDINRCHFLVDLEMSSSSSQEPHYSKDTSQWELLYGYPYLDSMKASILHRTLYIPGLKKRKGELGRYVLLQNKKGNFVKNPNDIL